MRRSPIEKKPIIVAIDGPAASGKSTTAKILAGRLGYTYIDTGAMYRSVTLKVIREGLLDEIRKDETRIAELLRTITIGFQGERVLLDGEDVSEAIRENRVSREVSFISSLKPVRDKLRELQQEMGRKRGIVMDGRDIGTVIFPDAELKIFLIADPAERAKRRHAELLLKAGGAAVPSVDELEEEIKQRDRDDEQRTHAPLKRHPDAVLLDTSNMTIDEQVNVVYDLVNKIVEQQSL
ncbi:cytidylate kinase [Chlorobaculum parvum NCIB 8327]|uniref:Cytidylate kinase n=1 Tax=Chlorobaculum parvum (strain DSM 263 / NCIMB 8327) TaxID=517417 RepID=B3QQD7_CHLP8|nr:(d)CMP kinase [Chlorobaculum parvum]ACF12140.1 cytidylate kinase [Chlorobaculum parvum NCIB 8327]